MIKVGFKKLTDDAILPVKAHLTDSGFDLFANETVSILPGETRVIKTGIAIHLPEGYEAQVRPRSGVTLKTKLRVQLGTIDQSYTGDLGIIIDNTHSGRYSGGAVRRTHFAVDGDISRLNLGDQKTYGSYDICKGDKLAQLVIQELPQVEAFEIENLPNTERGSNGFGSSGY